MSPEQILADLYEIDPSLKEHDRQLRPLIAQILASKPDTQFNANFAAKLRQQLMSQPTTPHSLTPHSPTFFTRMNNLKYFLPAGTLVALVAIILITSSSSNLNQPAGSPTSGQIVALSDNAFGKLSSTNSGSSAPQAPALGTAEGRSSTPTLDIDTGANPVPAPLPIGAGGGAGVTSKMIAPDSMIYRPISFKFTYRGEAIPDIPAQLPVLRRVRPNLTTPPSNLNNLFPGINLNSLSNLQIQNFNLVQNQPYGLNVFVDLREGNISINQNYDQWPHPENHCQDEACFNNTRLSAADVPTDSALIAQADAFLVQLGISRENYGAGQVQRHQFPQLLAATSSVAAREAAVSDTSYPFIPDSLQVIYPRLINGSVAYDESGNPTGMSVSVNLRENRADGFWGLDTANYESSDYAMETDKSIIQKIAEQGGRYGYGGYYGDNVEIKEITLGTPELTQVIVWQYNGSQSNMLLVPAYRFPVTSSVPEYTNQAVIVPLAKDILAESNFGGGIMPMVKGAPAIDAVAPVEPKPTN